MIHELTEPTRVNWSVHAEQSLLGAMLFDTKAIDEIKIGRADFFDQRHGVIWAAIVSICAGGKPVDVITVYQHLSDADLIDDVGGLEYLNALAQSVPSAANAKRYAEIIAGKSMDRALASAADKAVTVAKSDQPLPDRLDRILGSFAELQRGSMSQAPKTLAEIAMARIDHYTALEAGEVSPGWKTGIPTLDSMLSGGFRPGSLYILAARPSVGKSSFSQTLGFGFAAQGLPVLMLSQEMSADELADRAVAMSGRISLSSLLSGKMDHDGWSRVTDAAEAIAHLPMHIDDQPALTISDIRAKARQVKGLKVLIVDYLQLCSSSIPGENRNAQIEEISRGLKSLAKALGVAVVALSQLNRAVEARTSKRPTLADLRDSGAIEQDADVVMFLWPVREYGERKLVGCGVDKNRQGRCGEFGLDFRGAIQRWGESTESIQPPASSIRSRSFE
jgi:replicative DNA helicase